VASPTKFGEYLAAGLPVIMTDCKGNFSKLAKDSNVGLVLSSRSVVGDQDPDDIVESIFRYLQQCRVERDAVAKRCQAIGREHLHWDGAGRRLLDANNSLLDGAGATAPHSRGVTSARRRETGG